MTLVAGLGNPGRDFDRTYHNIGYDVADFLCQRLGGKWKESAKFLGYIAMVTAEYTELLLVKPLTYMNVSGNCVGPIMRYYKLAPTEVIAVVDDVELPPGRLRVRPSGGAGGHNGLFSLIEALGTSEFPRVRIGVGRGEHRELTLRDHVLQTVSAPTRAILDKVVPIAADAVCTVARCGAHAAMNQYNGISFEEKKEEDKTLEDKPC